MDYYIKRLNDVTVTTVSEFETLRAYGLDMEGFFKYFN